MDGAHLKILVAEANQLLAEAIADVYAEVNGGFPCLIARTVDEALDLATKESPDLIVIDHRLTREGIESAVRHVVERSPRSQVVVIVTRLDDVVAEALSVIGARCIEKDELHVTARSLVDSARKS